MSSTKSKSKQNVIGEMQMLVAGLKQNLSGQTIVLGGKTIQVADLITQLEAYVTQLNATAASRAAWLVQVETTHTVEATQIEPLVTSLHSFLEGTYGASSQTLTSFGMTPRKIRARTSKQKAATAAKAEATRVARNTLGPRQKEAIHGTVPATPPEPASTPASPSSGPPPVTPELAPKR